MEQIKRSFRDSLNNDLHLPPRDQFRLGRSLTTAPVEHDEFVSHSSPKRRNCMVGLFGRQEIEADL